MHMMMCTSFVGNVIDVQQIAEAPWQFGEGVADKV